MTASPLVRAYAAIVALALLFDPSSVEAAARKPNIVFILADDLGWTDLGVQGSKFYETPNIDRLAAQGLRFTRYYHSPNCQPTRAALMTGQYAPRTGVYTVGGTERFDWQSRPLRPVENVTKLPLDKYTMAQALKSAGYATGMFGKWHLGEDREHHPAARGFDEAIASAGKHFDFSTNPKTAYPPGTYLADFLTEKAAEFIRKHKDEPFFLYLPHFGVHSPFQAKPELIARFANKPPVGGHRDATYAAMIASVDESVGRVMALLDELKLSDDTIVIFSSDNGGVGGYEREGIKGDKTDNAPLRSGKGSVYEGGIRVPFIVRWPGVSKAGATCDTPAVHVDLFPTLCELAEAKPASAQPLDGKSLVPLLRNPEANLDREAIHLHFPGYLGSSGGTWRTTPSGVTIAGDWKLIERFETNALELYHLRDDIGETKNLAESHSARARELHTQMLAWRKEINAPMPTPNAEQASAPGRKRKRQKSAEDE